MSDKNFEAEGRFYAKCAEILGVDHTYKPWTGRPPNRWNNRHPGNGRFEGIGVIRMHSPTSIHVCLRSPKAVNKLVSSVDEVYALLERLIAP